MAKKIEEILRESALDGEVQELLTEAWNARLLEAREQISEELREEFSQRFEHDKSVMVESLDQFINDRIVLEMNELAQDRRQIAEERKEMKAKLKEHAKKLENFVLESLAKEMRELHAERKSVKENISKLEAFTFKQLSEEVRELRQDKKALVEQRVKLVAEHDAQLAEARKKFLANSAVTVEKFINESLTREFKQYREDLKEARQNDFGKRIFDAFAVEFMASYLNEGSELKKASKQIDQLKLQLDEAMKQSDEARKLVEGARLETKLANEKNERIRIMSELMGPLGAEKRKVMLELLESVKTTQLKSAFDKYLPAVLNESITKREQKSTLVEGVLTEKNGDRVAVAAQGSNVSDIEQIRRLAGI